MNEIERVISELNCSQDINDNYEKTHEYFKENFIEKQKWWNGYPIQVDDEIIDNYEKSFIHLITVEDKNSDIYPCQNHLISTACKTKCIKNCVQNRFLFLSGGNSVEQRVECVYRAYYVPLASLILDWCIEGENQDKIKIWEYPTKHNKSLSRLNIRYTDGVIDYVLILDIDYNYNKPFYQLITAYPIVFKSFKKRFDKEYKKYKKEN